MSKAYSKNRTLSAELPQQIDADARILRGARPGRNQDTFRTQSFYSLHRDLIVAAHHDFRSQLTQILHQVVGEGIVIIENKDHCYQITSAAGLCVSRRPKGTGDE